MVTKQLNPIKTRLANNFATFLANIRGYGIVPLGILQKLELFSQRDPFKGSFMTKEKWEMALSPVEIIKTWKLDGYLRQACELGNYDSLFMSNVSHIMT